MVLLIERCTMAKEKYSYEYALKKYEPFRQNEEIYNNKLKEDNYYIIRFDGKGMTKGFKAKPKAINETFFNTMENTFNEFCKTYPFIIFGYSFSDEISILIKGGKDENAEENRIEKLLSLLSCKIALLFNKFAQKYALDLKNKDWLFDARIISLKRNQVISYFLARQAFAIDKYIMQLKTEHGIDYNLKTSKLVLAKLKTKGIEYKKLPAKYRYGLTYSVFTKRKAFEFETDQALLQQMCFDK